MITKERWEALGIWETIDREEETERLKVFGGWIVRIYTHGSVFVPDQKHEWKI